jgi:hypothetical protein
LCRGEVGRKAEPSADAGAMRPLLKHRSSREGEKELARQGNGDSSKTGGSADATQ